MSKKIVKTNLWRCVEYCPNCPFLDEGRAMHLNDGRVDDIMQDLLQGGSFNCHKTVYNLDNDMNETPEQVVKMCYGAYVFLKKKKRPNQIMQVADRLGYG